MASFQRFEEGMEIVYDYAVFVDINVYGNDDKKELVFYSLYNDMESYMTLDNKYDEAHNIHFNNSLLNADAAICTFAKIAITCDDNWICELYTPEEIMTKISEEDFNALMHNFKRYLMRNIEKKDIYDDIRKEIDNAIKGNSLKLVECIGKWKQERYIYGGEVERYIRIMETNCLNYTVAFPIDKFVEKYCS